MPSSNPYKSFSKPTASASPGTSNSSPLKQSISPPSLLTRLKLYKNTLPPLLPWQKIVATMYCVVSVFCISLCFVPARCNKFTLPFTLVCNSVAFLSFALLVVTPPYEFEDAVFYLLQSFSLSPKSSINRAITPWRRLNVMSYALGLGTTVGSTVLLGTFDCMESNTVVLASLVCVVGVAYVSLCLHSVVILKGYILASDVGEGSVLLRWIRCSCCSRPIKKAFSLFPFLALAIFGIVVTFMDWNQRCDTPLHLFLVLSSSILLVYFLIGLHIFYFGRERRGRAVVIFIALNTVTGMVVSTLGIVWLSQSSTCSTETPDLYKAALSLKVMLLAATCVVAFFGTCCKVENCIHRDEADLHPVNEPYQRNSEGSPSPKVTAGALSKGQPQQMVHAHDRL